VREGGKDGREQKGQQKSAERVGFEEKWSTFRQPEEHLKISSGLKTVTTEDPITLLTRRTRNIAQLRMTGSRLEVAPKKAPVKIIQRSESTVASEASNAAKRDPWTKEEKLQWPLKKIQKGRPAEFR